MNLFRSEERIEHWLGARQDGVTIPVTKLSELADAWWDNRPAPDWRPRPRAQNQAILERRHLTRELVPLPEEPELCRACNHAQPIPGGASTACYSCCSEG